MSESTKAIIWRTLKKSVVSGLKESLPIAAIMLHFFGMAVVLVICISVDQWSAACIYAAHGVYVFFLIAKELKS